MSFGDGVARALIASWGLLRGNAKALDEFDNSVDGFWHSFFAIPLALPFVLYQGSVRGPALAELQPNGSGLEAGDPLSWISTLIITPIAWVAFPVVMVFLSRALNVAQNYIRFVIPYNWTAFLIVLIGMIPDVAYASGLLPLGAYPIPLFFVGVGALVLQWFVTWKALEVPVATAIGLLFLDIVLTMMTIMMLTAVFVGLAGQPAG